MTALPHPPGLHLHEVEGETVRQIDFLGSKLHIAPLEATADWIVRKSIRSGPGETVVHFNANNFYHLAHHPEAMRRLDDEADILMDGIAMKAGSWLLGHGWLPDVSGTDLFPLVMHRCVASGVPVFFLGASRQVVDEAVKRTRSLFPGLIVAGQRSGYFSHQEEPLVCQQVADSGARLLISSRGSPIRTRFLLDNRKEFRVGCAWDVGGLFDFVSGAKRRAPLAWRRLRLEWLFRFLLEPRRMSHRNLVVPPWLFWQIARAWGRKLLAAPNGRPKSPSTRPRGR